MTIPPQYDVDITWSLTATYDASGTYSMQITYGSFGDLVSDDITISVVGKFPGLETLLSTFLFSCTTNSQRVTIFRLLDYWSST